MSLYHDPEQQSSRIDGERGLGSKNLKEEEKNKKEKAEKKKKSQKKEKKSPTDHTEQQPKRGRGRSRKQQ